MRRLTLFVCLFAVSTTLSAQTTESIYQNTPWVSIPPDGIDHYQLVPISKSVLEGSVWVTADKAQGWILSVDGNNHALESNDLRLGCIILELPIGTTLLGELNYSPATVADFKNAILFRAPQTALSWPPFFPPHPYHIPADKQLYLMSQARNTGVTVLGPVTCVSQVYYLMPE